MKMLDFVSTNGDTKYSIAASAVAYIDNADGAEDRVVVHAVSGKYFTAVGRFDDVVERVKAAIEMLGGTS